MKNYTAIFKATIACLLLAAAESQATVVLPAPFSSSMVVQQHKPVLIWGKADAGETVTATFCEKSATTRATEAGTFRIELPALDAKSNPGPHELSVIGSNTIVLKDVLLGEVWLCGGQSNMRLTVKEAAHGDKESSEANYPQIRLLYVPGLSSAKPEFTFAGKWAPCKPGTVAGFSAAAYYFGRELHQTLGVPVGLIDCSQGWSPAEAWLPLSVLSSDPITKPIVDRQLKLAAEKDLDVRDKEYRAELAVWKAAQAKAKVGGADKSSSTQPDAPRPKKPFGVDPRLRAEALFNSMLAPLRPMPLAGVIWYQGESNSDRARQYRTLLPMVIKTWRQEFQSPELPFGIVQLPQHVNKERPVDGTWAELRDAQLRTHRAIPNTGLIVTTDIGEPFDIHPRNKQDVGKRLAGWALSSVYGQAKIPSCPLYKSVAIEGSRAKVEFDGNFTGLTVKGDALNDIFIAGDDKKFVPAKAEIQGNAVVVWSDEVKAPVAVRYAWSDNPKCNLFSTDGLPASPFRTDDWPGITDGVLTTDWQ